MKNIVIFIFAISFADMACADALDKKLSDYIREFNFKPVERLNDFRPELIRLGSKLFGDLRLSLTGDKSCFACHVDFIGSGDNLPLALGVGTLYAGMPSGIFQNTAKVTKRHTRPLYNKGHSEFKSLFTDARVSKTPYGWKTPDHDLNNNKAPYKNIVKTLDSTLAVQALFPMVDSIEMRGEENQSLTNLEVWDEITSVLTKDPNLKRFFKEAFGNVKINIGHIANAIAHFEKYFFQVTETKWDKYLRGNLSALSDSEKRGAILFSGKAKCANCHSGKHLSDFSFENTLVPRLSQSHDVIDYGLFDITGKKDDKFKAIVSPLRNISLTSPYFSSGIAITLEDVVEHYNDPILSLTQYDPTNVNSMYINNFGIFNQLFLRPDSLSDINEQLKLKSKRLSLRLGLSESEKKDLVEFLNKGLTEVGDNTPEELAKNVLKESWKLP